MKRINKKIMHLFIETIFLVILIITTYIIWDSHSIEDLNLLAYSYNTHNNNLKLIKSENMEGSKDTFIKIVNESNEIKTYNIYLIVNNKDREYVQNNIVTISTKSEYLRDLNSIQDEIFTYYKIITESITQNNIDSYFIRFNSNIKYDIKLEEE